MAAVEGRTSTVGGKAQEDGRSGRAYWAELPDRGTSCVSRGSELPVAVSKQTHVNLFAIRRFLLCRAVDRSACYSAFQPWESMPVGQEAERGKLGLQGWDRSWRA